ncbi:MAG: hypothetical protein WC470_02200 [Candidatus Paceibacterota bacterium]
MEKIIRSLEVFYRNLIKDDNSGKKLLAIQRFNEVLLRLQIRKEELTNIENEIFYRVDNNEPSLEEVQIRFVNKTESFHQQIYATISTFSMLLNHTASHDFKRDMPIKSNTDFLSFLSNKYKNLENDIKILELSRDFRAKFDHIQQNSLFDWMTESINVLNKRRCTIIFFLRKSGNGMYSPGIPLNTYSSDYYFLGKPRRIGPPFDCESYYVSPYHEDVYKSAINVFVNIIKNI